MSAVSGAAFPTPGIITAGMQLLLLAFPQPQAAREEHWELAFSSGLSLVSKQ